MWDGKSKPKKVVLCGSTRFKAEYEKAERDETLKGNIVLTVGLFGHHEGLDMDGPVKEMLDKLHLAKIDEATEVLVINVGGYIGESTKREIAYAQGQRKLIRYLEDCPQKDYAEEGQTDWESLSIEDPDAQSCLPYLDGKPALYVVGGNATEGWLEVIEMIPDAAHFRSFQRRRRVYGRVQLLKRTPERFAAWEGYTLGKPPEPTPPLVYNNLSDNLMGDYQ